MTTDNFPYDETEDETFHIPWMQLIMIAFIIWAILSSCNNAKHMEVTNPHGYWMHGKYLSNHSKPKSNEPGAKQVSNR